MKIDYLLKNIVLILILVMCSGKAIASDSYKMLVCNGCTYQQKKSKAIVNFKPYTTVNVQVADVLNGTVVAFNVYHEIEPGYSNTDIYNVSPRSDVIAATKKANKILSDMRKSVESDPELRNRVRDLYPNLTDNLSIVSIPTDVVMSASDVGIGNLEHLALSRYLSQQINIPIADKLLNALMSSFPYAVIAVFEGDGSILVLTAKVSSIKYEPLGGIYIDKDGKVRLLATNAEISNLGGADDGQVYNPNSSFNRRLSCSLWVTYRGTTADGTYCEEWQLY